MPHADLIPHAVPHADLASHADLAPHADFCSLIVLQAEDLHKQLMHRQKNVEYRLKEFEADVWKNFPVGTRLKH